MSKANITVYPTNDQPDLLLIKHVSEQQQRLIAMAYTETRLRITSYIAKRVNDLTVAEDLTQDVFVRLLEYGATVSPATITNLIYTVARNLTFDYLRRKCRRNEAEDFITASYENTVTNEESGIVARDLESHERHFLTYLPPKRRQVYELNRFDGMGVADIAKSKAISVRTVENHLRIARTELRGHMARLIRI